MDLYNMILDVLRERGCAFTEKYPKYYVCSIGAHMLNLHNWKKRILLESGLLFDTRLHLFFVSPPGYSKTFWLRQFIDPRYGLLAGTRIKSGFEQYMTEAGWTGSVSINQGEPVVFKGAAWEYRYGIIGCEEFAALTDAMKQKHSAALDTALLSSLDTGIVRKRLRGGLIKYETHVTLWAGTQPARFDLSSGMGRRFLFLLFIPTKTDTDIIRQARRRAKNIRTSPAVLSTVRQAINRKMEEVLQIESVQFSPQVYKALDRLCVPPFEEMLYEKLLVGYTVMTSDPVPKDLVVEVDKEAEFLLKLNVFWRDQVRRGSEFAQVLQIVREHRGKIDIVELRDKLLDFGLDWVQSSRLIWDLVRARILKYEEGILTLRR